MDGERARIVMHVDMDAFYAAVEVRDDPTLAGRALIVGGPRRRGVVATASYEARRFGVHSAMPMARALALCPHATVLAPRMGHYAEVSAQIMRVLAEFSPVVEPLSLDEAFLDMTGAERLFGPPEAMARAVQRAVRARTALSCSVGVACNKFLAKLASDLEKPGGLVVVPFGAEAAFVAPLPVRRLWGVGPRAAERLAAGGLGTIGEVARADSAALARAVGSALGAHVQRLARAEDDRPVTRDHARVSLGAEVTLAEDVRGRAAIEPVLRARCERVARGLRRAGLCAGGVRVKLRYSRGFRLATRQARLEHPADDSATLFATARALLERLDLRAPVRLVGVAVYALATERAPQLELFPPPAARAARRRSALEHAVDRIRDRFGAGTIAFGGASPDDDAPD
jgi:DNA polymerase-4